MPPGRATERAAPRAGEERAEPGFVAFAGSQCAPRCLLSGRRPPRGAAGSGVAKGVPGPRCPQLFAQFWSPWGPLGLVRGALDAVGASLELLGTPWARDTFGNPRNLPEDELMDRMVGAATFTNMKKNAKRYVPNSGKGFWKNDSDFLSNGSNNKWVDLLSAQEIASYDRRMDELLDAGDRNWLEYGSEA